VSRNQLIAIGPEGSACPEASKKNSPKEREPLAGSGDAQANAFVRAVVVPPPTARVARSTNHSNLLERGRAARFFSNRCTARRA